MLVRNVVGAADQLRQPNVERLRPVTEVRLSDRDSPLVLLLERVSQGLLILLNTKINVRRHGDLAGATGPDARWGFTGHLRRHPSHTLTALQPVHRLARAEPRLRLDDLHVTVLDHVDLAG